MSDALAVVGYAIAMLGGAVIVIAALGMLRMPDLFTRIHAAGVVDSLGAALVLVGLAVASGVNTASARLLMILAFLWITAPTACHALAKIARAKGMLPPERDRLGPTP